MGASQGFSAGRFVIQRCDTKLERICCPHCDMPIMGNQRRAECLTVCVCCPEGSVWRYSICVVSAVGFVCLREWAWVGESMVWPLTPPRLSLSLRSREIQGLLASPPHAPHKVTFRGTLFPPNPKHTTLFFPGRRPGKVGVHMRGILLSADGTGDPTCEGTTQFIQPGPRPGNTLASVTHRPTSYHRMCWSHTFL